MSTYYRDQYLYRYRYYIIFTLYLAKGNFIVHPPLLCTYVKNGDVFVTIKSIYNQTRSPKFSYIKRLRKTASSIPLLEEARIKSEWAIRLSDVISPVDAARIGTAGYTAMLCVQVQYLEHSVSDPYSIESGSSQKSQSGSGFLNTI